MNVLSSYESLNSEYTMLFNIFSQADDQSVELSISQIKLFNIMTPSFDLMAPGDTPGMILYPDKFYNALIRVYQIILDINKSIQLTPQDTYVMNNLQDLILWDWIIVNDLLLDVEAIQHSQLELSVRSTMNSIWEYNDIL